MNTTDAAGDWLVTMTHAPSVQTHLTDPRAAPEQQPLAAWEEDLNEMCQASPRGTSDPPSTGQALFEVERQFVPASLDAAAVLLPAPPLRAGVGVGSAGDDDPSCDERWGHNAAGGSALERERCAHRAAEAAGEGGVVGTMRNSWAEGLEGLWESARSLAVSASSVLLGTDGSVMLASPTGVQVKQPGKVAVPYNTTTLSV